MTSTFAFLDLGASELLVILAILLLLFGSKKLPELSKSLGSSIKEVRNGVSTATELRDEVKNQVAHTKQAIQGSDSTQPHA